MPNGTLLTLMTVDAADGVEVAGVGHQDGGEIERWTPPVITVDGVEMRSCVTPLSAVTGKRVTTLEGLPALYAEARGLARVPQYTPLQQAVIDEQAIQCGYCYNGMLIKATELLNNNPSPSDDEIRAALDGHLCRCGTYPRLLGAIRKAADAMGGAA